MKLSSDELRLITLRLELEATQNILAHVAAYGQTKNNKINVSEMKEYEQLLLNAIFELQLLLGVDI
jgi:hypothetical protein